jgi:hypothetical protein
MRRLRAADSNRVLASTERLTQETIRVDRLHALARLKLIFPRRVIATLSICFLACTRARACLKADVLVTLGELAACSFAPLKRADALRTTVI